MTLSVAVEAAAPIPLSVAFDVAPGELLALVGPSGSGKTTLLRTIAGLWHPQSARVSVEGALWLDTARGLDLPPYRRRVGVVFQSYALFPHLSALGNIASAMHDLPLAERQAEAERLLDLVNLNGLGRRRPRELSGGQQQRVALARALARRPAALLLDEPFSAVDRATRDLLQAEIIALRGRLSMPTILVTHDMTEAQLLADRMLVIEAGRTVAEGSTAEVMSNPAALRVMGLTELASLLPTRIAEHTPDGMTRLDGPSGPIWLPRVEGAPGSALRLRILANDVLIAREQPVGLSAQNILPATITRIEPDAAPSPGVTIRLSLNGVDLLARVTGRAVASLSLAEGMPVHAVLKSMSVARDGIRPVARGATAASSGGDRKAR